MVHKCRFCGKEYDTYYQLGGHVVNCILNPKRDERNLKLSKIGIKRKIYHLTCKNCNKDYVVIVTEKAYLKGDYNKYCSRICANSRKHTKEEKEKISNSLKGRPNPRKGIDTKRDIRDKLFGTKCFFCDFENKGKQYLHTHRKDGIQHKSITGLSIKELKEINPKEYVRICRDHHKYVHWCMKYLGMNWEEIEKKYINNKH